MLHSWELKDTLVSKSVDGDFFGGQHKVFYFDAQLVADSEYEIKLTNTTGQEVTSKTEIITYDQFQFLSRSTSKPFERTIARKLNFITNGEFSSGYSFQIFAA